MQTGGSPPLLVGMPEFGLVIAASEEEDMAGEIALWIIGGFVLLAFLGWLSSFYYFDHR